MCYVTLQMIWHELTQGVKLHFSTFSYICVNSMFWNMLMCMKESGITFSLKLDFCVSSISLHHHVAVIPHHAAAWRRSCPCCSFIPWNTDLKIPETPTTTASSSPRWQIHSHRCCCMSGAAHTNLFKNSWFIKNMVMLYKKCACVFIFCMHIHWF